MSAAKIVTAAMLAIGDELLSGRTKDQNIAHLADALTVAGIDLKEVRIVPDEMDSIVDAVNALRAKYDYVFTSGGIGPTHDDITADAISAAFGVPCIQDEEAIRLLGDMYQRREMEFTEARQRMARMPQGSAHIANPVSVAPGFIKGNVHVMAGVPSVFQAMLNEVLPTLPSGAKVFSRTVPCPFGEGDIGVELRHIQADNPETSIGSYPKFNGKNYSTDIVIRARDENKIATAATAVEAMIEKIRQIRGAA